MVKGAVVARRIRICTDRSHVIYIASVTGGRVVKVRTVAATWRRPEGRNRVARSRVEPVAVAIRARRGTCIISRLIPLVFTCDRHAAVVPSHGIPRDRVVLYACRRQHVNACLGIATSQPVREPRRIPERHKVHRVVLPTADRAVGVAAAAAAAVDAAKAVRHARIVEAVGVCCSCGIQESRVLRVRHLIGAYVEAVRNPAITGREVIQITRMAHEDRVDSDDSVSRGRGQQASSEETEVLQFHATVCQ